MLVIQQPDGTLAQVPEWMTAPEAGSADIRDEPRLSLTLLRELRLGADTALSSVLCSCRHQIRADDGIASSSLAAFG